MKLISKKFWYSSTVIVLILAFSGCRKSHQNPVPVKGIFWDYFRNKPLTGFKMQLIEYGNNFWGNNEYSEVIAETTTDVNGLYDFGAPELDDRERYNYRVIPVYSSDVDSLTIGVGNAAPWYVKNTNGSPRLNKVDANWDTIRAASFTHRSGRRFYNLPSNPGDIDSMFLTVSHWYDYPPDETDRNFIDYSTLLQYQDVYGSMNNPSCGFFFWRKEKKVSGIWYVDTDTVFVEWKTSPTFNDTINWDW
jgi:hypothetical protein